MPCYAIKPIVDVFCGKDGSRDACRRFGVRDGFNRREMLLDFALIGSMGASDFEPRNDFRFLRQVSVYSVVLLKRLAYVA